jgi:hypothetical protein
MRKRPQDRVFDKGGFVSDKSVSLQQETTIRRPYTKPKLILYGPVEKLTQGATGSTSDFLVLKKTGG